MNQSTYRVIQNSVISLLRQIQDIVSGDAELEPRVIRLISLHNEDISPSLFAFELMAFILIHTDMEEYVDYTRDTNNTRGFLYNVFWIMRDGGITRRDWIETIDIMYNSNIAYFLKRLINYIYIFSDSDLDSDSDYDSDMDFNSLFVEALHEYIDIPPSYQNSSSDKLLDAGLPVYSEFSLSNVRIV
jgi:hypothetical protein